MNRHSEIVLEPGTWESRKHRKKKHKHQIQQKAPPGSEDHPAFRCFLFGFVCTLLVVCKGCLQGFQEKRTTVCRNKCNIAIQNRHMQNCAAQNAAFSIIHRRICSCCTTTQLLNLFDIPPILYDCKTEWVNIDTVCLWQTNYTYIPEVLRFFSNKSSSRSVLFFVFFFLTWEIQGSATQPSSTNGPPGSSKALINSHQNVETAVAMLLSPDPLLWQQLDVSGRVEIHGDFLGGEQGKPMGS